MPDQLQLRGGTTVQHSTFTGASKEVTVDTTKKTVVVHDGSTAGGNPVMREDASNSALALGSAGTPSLKFTGDTNTGIYSPGADQVAISTGGSGRLFINATGEILAGTSTSVDGNWKIQANAGAGSLAGIGVNNNGGYGVYLIYDNSARYSGAGVLRNIANSPLAFETNNTERLRITSAGLVGVGTSAPAQLLHLKGSGDVKLLLNSTNNANDRGIYFATSTDNEVLGYIKQEYSTGLFEISSGSGTYGSGIGFRTGGVANRVVIDSSGRLGLGTTDINDNLVVSAGNYRGLTLQTATSTDRPTVYFRNTGATAASFVQGLGQNLIFGRAPASDYGSHTETARIDSSGRLLVGTSTARAFGTTGSAPLLEVESSTNPSLSITRTGADQYGSYLGLGKIRSTSIVNSGDDIGIIGFEGYDGSALKPAASITVQVDGTPGANDMPGRLVFSTTADGASSPTERMRISSDGAVKIAGDNFQIATSKTPASATAAGTTGQVAWDASYIYVCTATNTWKRAALSTW